jgi:hypothetical protein
MATIIRPPIDAPLDPGNVDTVRHVPAWPEFTELVQDDDGTYKQTGQTTEISSLLSAAVKRANSNLLLINSFPEVEEQEQWLVDALRLEFSTRAHSHVIKVVGERASVEINYFRCLLSMVMIAGSVWRRF